MKKPNLFIAGAPKAGTTAMYEYLRQHPMIYPAAKKEPNFFNDDFPRGAPLRPEQYLALYNGAKDEKWLLEGTTWYLASRVAAKNIHDFSPNARIIIMLRHPVEAMHALHSQNVYSGKEPELDFHAAIERDNQTGVRLPKRNGPPEMMHRYYFRVYSYCDQVKRYLEQFHREQIRFIFFDDLRRDTESCIRDTYRFLEIDEDFKPNVEIVNPNKVPRIPALQRFFQEPPSWLERVFNWSAPNELRRKRIRSLLLRLNSKPAKRPELDPSYVSLLTQEMADEIRALGELLGRDLDNWLENKPLDPVEG